jgi:hypothetical protein
MTRGKTARPRKRRDGQRLVDPGGFIVRGIRWTNIYTGDAPGLITGDMSGTNEGRFRIQIGQLDQQIGLVSRPRHFGDKQWHLSPHEALPIRSLEAARCPRLRLSAAVEMPSRLGIAILDADCIKKVASTNH